MSLHKGDIGTVIQYDTLEDISDGTVFKLKYTKPDGTTTGEWTGSLSGTRIVQYTTASASDLDQAGTWQLQAYVETPSGKWHSDIKTFIVEDNISVA